MVQHFFPRKVAENELSRHSRHPSDSGDALLTLIHHGQTA